jgi:hypothetical protein
VPAENSEQPKQQRKLPERADALTLDLPFEDAVRAALAVKPEPKSVKRKVRKSGR